MKRKILFVHETFGRMAGAEQNILVTAPHLAAEFELECLYWNRSGKDEASFEKLCPVHHAVDFEGPPDDTRERSRFRNARQGKRQQAPALRVQMRRVHGEYL